MAKKKQQPTALKLSRAMKVREDLMKRQETLRALDTARMAHRERIQGENMANELSRITGQIGTMRNGHEIIRRHALQGRADHIRRLGVRVPALKLDLR